MNAIAHNTADRNAEIALARREGLASLTDLADRYGISRERVRQIASRQGVDPVEAARAYVERHGTSHPRVELDDGAVSLALHYWRQGLDHERIAKSLRAMGIEANTSAVRSAVREYVTERDRAARRASRVAASNVHYDEAPRDAHRSPREDRRWGAEQIVDALVTYARARGGELPSSRAYDVDARCDDSLPSLSTIRNRLGRYTSVRLMVYEKLEQEEADDGV